MDYDAPLTYNPQCNNEDNPLPELTSALRNNHVEPVDNNVVPALTAHTATNSLVPRHNCTPAIPSLENLPRQLFPMMPTCQQTLPYGTAILELHLSMCHKPLPSPSILSLFFSFSFTLLFYL